MINEADLDLKDYISRAEYDRSTKKKKNVKWGNSDDNRSENSQLSACSSITGITGFSDFTGGLTGMSEVSGLTGMSDYVKKL
jgi:hypothetical protein